MKWKIINETKLILCHNRKPLTEWRSQVVQHVQSFFSQSFFNIYADACISRQTQECAKSARIRLDPKWWYLLNLIHHTPAHFIEWLTRRRPASSRTKPGVCIIFLRHSPVWFSIFPRQVKLLANTIERVSEREKKNSPEWRLGLYLYSPILNSTRIWRLGEWLSAPL
jgi:hypothetical protein